MQKLIVVLGATGKQGGSAVDEFLKDPNYRVRAVTRNPKSPAALNLVAKGAEVVYGELMDADSLIAAVNGAHVVYGVTTDFWTTNLALVGPASPSKSVLELAGDMERTQGMNILNAVLTILPTTLELFILSTLSAAKRISGGKYAEVYHFDAKADIIDLIRASHPELAKKTAALQLGYFATNWMGPTPIRPKRQADGGFVIGAVAPPHVLQPFVVPDRDPAVFVTAIAALPPQDRLVVYYGYSEMLSFEAWAALLSKALQAKVTYREMTLQEYEDETDFAKGSGVGRELGEMYAYASDYGFDGGEEGVVPVKSLALKRQPVTMEEYVMGADFSALL